MRLAKRTPLHPPEMRREYPAAKAWLAPQREHPTTPMPSAHPARRGNDLKARLARGRAA